MNGRTLLVEAQPVYGGTGGESRVMKLWGTLAISALTLLGPGVGRAQVGPEALGLSEDMASARIYLVPELIGAFTLSVEYGSRLDTFALLSGPTPIVPGTSVSARAGWRQYLDPWGRLNLGLYGGVGRSISGFGDDRAAIYEEATLGLSLQRRSMSPSFVYIISGLYAEGGALWVEDGSRDLTGHRWAAGLESGIGGLAYVEPYVFAEMSGRLGVEGVSIDGLNSTALTASLRISFDFCIPQGAASALEGDPYKDIPPLVDDNGLL